MSEFVDWDEIKSVFQSGHEDLEEVCVKYNVPLSEVLLKAKQEGWGTPGSGIFSGEEFKVVFQKDILTLKDVELAHQTDLGNLRLMAGVIIKQMQYCEDIETVLKYTERLAKIYGTVIPLERKVLGIEEGNDGSPDDIHIHTHLHGADNAPE